MKTLSIRNKTLLLTGASVCGNFIDAYTYIEESLYMNEAIEINEFCIWIDNNVGGAGRGNIDKLFLAFKNPQDVELQAYVKEVADKIKTIRNL
jgi:hypothetical protein